MPEVHYDSYTEARSNLKNLLDAAESGQVATVRRDSATTAVLDAARLRCFLASVVPSRAQVVQEAGGWSVYIPGLPVAADGASFDEAITKWVAAWRDYAHGGKAPLLNAATPGEKGGWVRLISGGEDRQLREWL